jgi:hypothetical protein
MHKIPLWSRIIFITFIIAILSLSLILATNIRSKSNYEYDYSWTKAICNETHCQDYEITCKDNKMISQNPITGAVIEISDDWKDPRTEEFKNKTCK